MHACLFYAMCVRMISIKSRLKKVACGDLFSSLSSTSSHDSDQEADESIFSDEQDDGGNGEWGRITQPTDTPPTGAHNNTAMSGKRRKNGLFTRMEHHQKESKM